MLFFRLKQFYSALTSKINPQDKKFLSKHLNRPARRLFHTMDMPTQRHCLNVAYKCIALSKNQHLPDVELLIKAALLHDCGKQAGEVKTWHRVIMVITNSLLPALTLKLVQAGFASKRGSLARAFYIDANHAARGAEMLDKIGLGSVVVYLVLNHHEQNIPSPTPELIVLKKADNAN